MVAAAEPVNAVPRPARFPSPGAQAGIDEEMIGRVVDTFYGMVRADPVLGPVFSARIAPERWPAHLAVMRSFWASVLLLTGEYKGKPAPAHVAMPLAEHHYRRWLGCFAAALACHCPPMAAALFMDRAERIAFSFLTASARAKSCSADHATEAAGRRLT